MTLPQTLTLTLALTLTRYMAPALRTGPLCRLFSHHEAEAEAARQPTDTSTQKVAAPHAESRAWSQTKPTNQETETLV